ncbi:hypothetical protein NOCA1240543 [metagenome]|uniref:Uncharacterized protein n=1 Tax=metagenome TaxID=256318 RepID=A0A2P2CHL0_9ZZZZ
MIAVLMAAIYCGRSSLFLADQRSEEEGEVLGLLGEAAHQVAVPLGAVGDVDAHRLACGRETLLLLGADAVEHLELVGPRAATEAARERGGDLDHPRVVGGDHRVALAAEQHLEAADVGLVDVDLLLEGDVLGLHVGALAQAHTGALVGEGAAVGLGAVQHRLQDGAGLGEVLAELAQDRQRRVGGGVVLHVEGDRRAGVAGGAADVAGVLERHLVPVVGEELPDRAELDRDLGVRGQALRGEVGEDLLVGRHGRLGLGDVGGVLAEVVEGDPQAVLHQRGGGGDRVGRALTGDVAGHDPAGDGHRRDELLDPLAAGEEQDRLAEQRHGAKATPIPAEPSHLLHPSRRAPDLAWIHDLAHPLQHLRIHADAALPARPGRLRPHRAVPAVRHRRPGHRG